MRLGRRYDYVRPARPKARSLKADEAEQVTATLQAAIDCSPVLRALGLHVRSLRSRFFLEWRWDPVDRPEEVSYGRITPLEEPPGELLLEVPYGRNQWSRAGTGSPEQLMRLVAGDTKGTFHGLGALDKWLRHAAKTGHKRLPVLQSNPSEFTYAESGKPCSAQETLYHFFGLPIYIIAQPNGWYSCHRTPRIVEFSEDRTRVLVRFTATSWSGETFGGTCLYLRRGERWGAYTIKPNQSHDIAMAEAWLARRNWASWG